MMTWNSISQKCLPGNQMMRSATIKDSEMFWDLLMKDARDAKWLLSHSSAHGSIHSRNVSRPECRTNANIPWMVGFDVDIRHACKAVGRDDSPASVHSLSKETRRLHVNMISHSLWWRWKRKRREGERFGSGDGSCGGAGGGRWWWRLRGGAGGGGMVAVGVLEVEAEMEVGAVEVEGKEENAEMSWWWWRWWWRWRW